MTGPCEDSVTERVRWHRANDDWDARHARTSKSDPGSVSPTVTFGDRDGRQGQDSGHGRDWDQSRDRDRGSDWDARHSHVRRLADR